MCVFQNSANNQAKGKFPESSAESFPEIGSSLLPNNIYTVYTKHLPTVIRDYDYSVSYMISCFTWNLPDSL